MEHTKSKISVTIPNDLENFIKYYEKTHDNMTRSAVIKEALELLRKRELAIAYRSANAEIDNSFDICVGDGLDETW